MYMLFILLCIGLLGYSIAFVYPTSLFIRGCVIVLIICLVGLCATYRLSYRISSPIIMATILLGGFRFFEILDLITCVLITGLSVVVYYILRTDGIV